MSKFLITPHFRLHEWVAEEKGYFKAEGLDYEFREAFKGQDLARAHATANKVGAYQNIEAGRDSNVSCACHWTVNVAASKGHAKMYADAYSVSPSAVFVPPESPIKRPEDLRGVPISVGHQSGSHYSTIQALEQYMPLSDIKLSFAGRNATSICGPSSTRTTIGTSSRRASSRSRTPVAGARASASSSSPTRRKCSKSLSAGSASTASSTARTWARAVTKMPACRCRPRSRRVRAILRRGTGAAGGLTG